MNKKTVLIVDDAKENLLLMEGLLSTLYHTIAFDNGYDAINYLYNQNEELPAIILLDIEMPGIDGYQVLETIQKHPEIRRVPVIIITAKPSELKALKTGASDYIAKPIHPGTLKLRIENQILLAEYASSLEHKVEQQINKISLIRETTINALAEVIEYRNTESGEHVKRVVHLYKALMDHLIENSIYSQEILDEGPDILVSAVPLHDIGKIGVADNILLKPGRLTEDEFEIMKTHTTIGKDIVENILDLDAIRKVEITKEDELYLKHCTEIAHYHHEKFDGNGYPKGLQAEHIPISARIMAIVDVYDALVSPRIYKKAFSHEKAMKIIRENAGSHFDPVLVLSAMELSDVFEEIEATY